MSARRYQLKYSDWIKTELARLKNGTDQESQRYDGARQAIAAIQSDPINKIFNKTLPENYKAADVLQQYRLFFKIYNMPGDTDIVFLVWMNDEDSIHESAQRGDTYEVFRDLRAKGEIETYSPAPSLGEPRYNQHGEWGEQCLYFRYKDMNLLEPKEGS